MGDLYSSERGQIGACLSGASVTKTAILLGVLRVTVSKGMSAYTNRGKTTSVKNSGQKSTLTKRDCRKMRRTVLKIIKLLQHR
jgi:IS30 family transposase